MRLFASNPFRRWPVRITCILAACLALCVGCQQPQRQAEPQSSSTAARIDASKAEAQSITSRLRGFAEHFSATVVATADDIATQTADRRIREICLRWKIHVVPAMRHLSFSPDPREGLINAWMMCIHMRNIGNSDEGRLLFGEYQPTVAVVAEQLEDEMAEIIRSYVMPEDFQEAQRDVEAFTAGYPIKGRFAFDIISASENARLQANPILGIPVVGLAESTEAVDRLASVAAAFTEIMQNMPEYGRWQLEALLMNFESLPTVMDTRADIERLSTSIETISRTTETLPEDVRAELGLFLDSADVSVQTLGSTIAEARSAIEALDETVNTSQEVVALVSETTAKVADTAEAWEATAHAINGAAETILVLARPEDGGEPAEEAGAEGGGFDIKDWADAGQRIENGAAELRLFLNDLQSERLSGAMAELTGTSQTPIDHAAGQAAALVNIITRRALMLIAVLFLALLVYRFIAVRLIRPAT